MRKYFEKYFLIFLGVQNSPQSLRVSLKTNKRRLKSNSSTIIDGFLKYEELFKKILSYLLGVSRFFHSLLLNGVQTSAPWNKPEFFKTWEAVSKNSFLLSSELPDVFTTSCYYDNLAYAVFFRITNRSGAWSLSPFFRGGE